VVSVKAWPREPETSNGRRTGAVDLLRVTRLIGSGQRRDVGQQVGEDQPGKVAVVKAGRQDTLDRPMRAIAGLRELVHRVPVAVLGERRRPGAVLGPIQ
jgi:hypothetical protein